jgi:hypothetical protein
MLGAYDRRASSSYISTVGFAAAFLFVAVDWVEPNHRLALVFKTAILAAGGAAIAHQLRHLCAIQASEFWPAG